MQWRTLEEAKNIFNSSTKVNHHSLIREIQLARTELEMCKHLESGDKTSLEKIGLRARKLALDHGYIRHAQIITDSLMKYL